MDHLKKILSAQIDHNRQKNLLYSSPGEIMTVDKSFLDIIDKLKEKSIPIDDDLINFVAAELIKSVYKVNQFINIPDIKNEELKNIYRQSWEIISESYNIEEALYKYHYPALSEWLSSLYPPLIKDYLKEQKEIRSVVCEEYSPQFQVQILQIDINKLLPPVLDIGCGRNANLVNYLRENNIEAYGIDRLIENETDCLFNADWLTYNLRIKEWGTIISNAAFSNHMMYTAKYDKEKLKDYLLKYNEIINSLKPGGEFIYAPGLAFIEERLDMNIFEITISSITGNYFLTKLKKKLLF